MALLEVRNGDWLLAWVRTELASSPPLSLSTDGSGQLDVPGDEATDEA